MRSRIACDRRALKRERAKYMPRMPFRAYLRAYAKLLAEDVINKQRNAAYANETKT